MTHIPDEDVQAAKKAVSERCKRTYLTSDQMFAALSAALPYLQPVDVSAVRRQAFEEGFENGVEQSLNALDAYDDITRNEAEQAIRTLKPDYRALSAEPVQRDQWQPIETAPKDGTVIQAWHKVHKCPVSVLWKEDGFPYRGERLNWYERSYTTAWPERAFSHWMPLPAAPTSEAGR